MKKKLKIILTILMTLTFITSSNIVIAKEGNEIIFKDDNLQSALCKFYDWNETFSKEDASKLSMKNPGLLVLENSKISDLEGLQYFNDLGTIYLGGNNLKNLKPLSMIKTLGMLDISNNALKGREFENALNDMGKIKNLDTLTLANNELTGISFLDNIGNIDKYHWINMENNNIEDISILKNAVNISALILSDNRITDVFPLKNLKNLTYCLDLKDNCIIDYKPIKTMLDDIYTTGGWENVISRYDYYTNPVDIGVNGKTIKFPYLTAYYKYQAYVEAVPLLRALGGSAKYDKKTGTLTCKYGDNVLVMMDFSKKYTLNGEKMSMKYPMRRMQYDLAYVPVKDICKALGLNYSVTKKRKIYETEDEYLYAPKYIEISLPQKELG